jgi:hypothetical protein
VARALLVSHGNDSTRAKLETESWVPPTDPSWPLLLLGVTLLNVGCPGEEEGKPPPSMKGAGPGTGTMTGGVC